MPRYIDAEPFDNMCMFMVSADERPVDAVFRMIYEAPTADVAPVVHGEWKTYKPLDEDGNIINGLGSIFRCSLCGEEVLFEPCNYCPNCGARMERREDAEIH